MDLSSSEPVVAREKKVQALYEAFQKSNRVVLAGKAGAGKTTLAREYIQRFGKEYEAVAWINATTDETFLADLCAALEKFSLPVDIAQGTEGLFRALHGYLNEQPKALLVLDHLPYAFIVQDAPDQPNLSYHFLLLTQVTKTPPELPRLELAGLEAREGALLILRQAGRLAASSELDMVEDEVRSDALELARELRGSPLALRLAGGYLCESGSCIREYLDLFREYPARFQLAGEGNKSGQQELAVAGELSLARIEQMHGEALECLRICALLLPEAIPDAWLREEGNAAQPPDTLQGLVSAGLLNANEDGSLLSMHPVMQQLTRQFCGLNEEPQRQKQIAQVLQRLRSQLPLLIEEGWSTRLRTVGHIQQLAKLSKQGEIHSPAAAEMFGWAATVLWEANMLSQAEALLRRALAIWEDAPEKVTQITIATALEKLAALNSQLQNYAEAEALAQRAITSKMAALGVNHPDVLILLNQLGQYYEAQDKQKEAKACYKKVTEVAEILKLRLHPVYSMAGYNLARICIEQEEFEQAEELLSWVCKIWSHMPGDSKPPLLEARLKLAEVAARLEHWKRVEDCYRQVLPIYEQDLGEEAPRTQEIRQKLEESIQMQVLRIPQPSK